MQCRPTVLCILQIDVQLRGEKQAHEFQGKLISRRASEVEDGPTKTIGFVHIVDAECRRGSGARANTRGTGACWCTVNVPGGRLCSVVMSALLEQTFEGLQIMEGKVGMKQVHADLRFVAWQTVQVCERVSLDAPFSWCNRRCLRFEAGSFALSRRRQRVKLVTDELDGVEELKQTATSCKDRDKDKYTVRCGDSSEG
jgi:hypothetical protein